MAMLILDLLIRLTSGTRQLTWSGVPGIYRGPGLACPQFDREKPAITAVVIAGEWE